MNVRKWLDSFLSVGKEGDTPHTGDTELGTWGVACSRKPKYMYGGEWSPSKPLGYRTVSSCLCTVFTVVFPWALKHYLLGFCIGLRSYANCLWQIKTNGGKWCLPSLFPSYLSSGLGDKLRLLHQQDALTWGLLSKTLRPCFPHLGNGDGANHYL